MKKVYLLSFSFIFLAFGTVLAQPRYRVFDFRDPNLKSISAHLQMGMATYFGDLCPNGDCYSSTKFNLGFGGNYRMNDYIFFTLNAQYYRIGASDQESGNLSRQKRNLSFRSDNFEFSGLVNFEFLNYNTFRYLAREEFPISMFFFSGAGLTTNKPKALYNGSYVNLRPLETEGKSYSSVAAVVPVGLGLSYQIIKQVSVSFLAGYRFTFSDYLDDVSSTYVDPATLSSPDAVGLAFRGDEFVDKNGNSFAGYGVGSKRGNPESKDGYLLIDFKVQYNFQSGGAFSSMRSRKTGRRKSTLSAPSRQAPRRR